MVTAARNSAPHLAQESASPTLRRCYHVVTREWSLAFLMPVQLSAEKFATRGWIVVMLVLVTANSVEKVVFISAANQSVDVL